MGAAAAELGGRSRRRRNPAEPVGQQHHDRQGADAAAAVRVAIAALPRRLCLFGGRGRRVDDRPGLGRAGRHLRDRRTCSPRPSGSARCRSSRSPMSMSAASARSVCARTRFGDCARRIAADGTPLAHGRVRLRARPRRARSAPHGRALSVCPGRPGDARRELLRGLQHPGPGAGAAAARRPGSKSW